MTVTKPAKRLLMPVTPVIDAKMIAVVPFCNALSCDSVVVGGGSEASAPVVVSSTAVVDIVADFWEYSPTKMEIKVKAHEKAPVEDGQGSFQVPTYLPRYHLSDAIAMCGNAN